MGNERRKKWGRAERHKLGKQAVRRQMVPCWRAGQQGAQKEAEMGRESQGGLQDVGGGLPGVPGDSEGAEY